MKNCIVALNWASKSIKLPETKIIIQKLFYGFERSPKQTEWATLAHSVIGVSTPPPPPILKNTTPSFFHQAHPPPFNYANRSAPAPFLGNYPYIYWFFVKPPTKNRIFQWALYHNFSSLIPSHLLKLTKYLVKICFYVKTATSHEKSYSLFPSNPPLKVVLNESPLTSFWCFYC